MLTNDCTEQHTEIHERQIIGSCLGGGDMKRFNLMVVACVLGLSVNAQASDRIVSEEGLVSYKITDEVAINASLTGVAGDAVKGRSLAINRKKGNCLACHAMPIAEQQFHGETAPTLYGVAARLNEGELRMQIVNSKVTNENTMMPSFYRVTGYNRPGKKFVGKTILSAQEVEDIVAYLVTLNSEETFSEAFATARKQGKSSFEWNNKPYTTQMAN